MVQLTSLTELFNQLESPVLGLDAYGVIYNDQGLFDTLPAVFEFCKKHQIPVFMMTNNSTQSIGVICQKMEKMGFPFPVSNIVSSGCGLTDIDQLKAMVVNQSVFVYGYESSKQYVIDAGGHCVNDPAHADLIVMAASLGNANHTVYRSVFTALKKRPTIPVICINPDHYVLNNNGFMSVMGYYAKQMAHQLDRTDFIWMGKPFPLFSTLIKTRLDSLGFDSHQLVFCDDNPHNVIQLTHDLHCHGVVIKTTGVFSKYESPKITSNDLYSMEKLKI